MRKLSVAGLAVAALLSMSVATASAQTVVGVGLGGGVAMPMGDFGDAAKMGFGGGAGVFIYPNAGNIGVRVDGGYFQFNPEADVDGKFKMMSGMGNLLYMVPTEGNIRPYIVAGAGLLSSKFDDGDSESAFAWQGGAGLSIGASNTRLFVEAKWVSSSKDGATTSYLPVLAGVSIRFK